MKASRILLIFVLIWNISARVSSIFHTPSHLILVSDNTTLVQEGSTYKNAVIVDAFMYANWVPGGYAVWDKASSPDYYTITLIKRFNIPGNPISCTFQAWVDNYFDLYVNDQYIGNWDAFSIEIDKPYSPDLSSKIINGDNVFKFIASNGVGDAGLLFTADIKYFKN